MALALAAPDYPNSTVGKIDVSDVDHDQLADAHSRCAQQTQHRVIAPAFWRVPSLAKLEQGADVLVLGSPWQRLFDFRRADALGWIAGDLAFASQVLEKRTQGGRSARNRRRPGVLLRPAGTRRTGAGRCDRPTPYSAIASAHPGGRRGTRRCAR